MLFFVNGFNILFVFKKIPLLANMFYTYCLQRVDFLYSSVIFYWIEFLVFYFDNPFFLYDNLKFLEFFFNLQFHSLLFLVACHWFPLPFFYFLCFVYFHLLVLTYTLHPFYRMYLLLDHNRNHFLRFVLQSLL